MDVDWLTAERVWLVHKGGFAAARVAKRNETMQPGHASDGKCRIRLEHGGEVLDVDEENVEKVCLIKDFSFASVVLLILFRSDHIL